MRNAQVLILSGADTGSITGSAIDVGQVVSASFMPVFGDATAEGTVKLQASNDLVANNNRATFVPTNWADIPSATSVIASGVGSAIVVNSMCFSYIRAVYTRSSGGSTTGTLLMNSLSC